MEFNNKTIVDSIHIFNNKNYEIKETLNGTHIQIVQEREANQLFYLIKKGEEFNSNSKYSFIDHCEKSFELIHPCLINLSGFSIEKPYLYYKYSQHHFNINNIKLSDENIQKIFIGLASVISYLYSKGFCLSNFSTKSIIFDSKSCPKLIDYINPNDLNKTNEKDSTLIIKYVELMKRILNKKKEENPSILINENLTELIERCEQRKNLPSFDDFINFFKTESYLKNSEVFKSPGLKRYLKILNLCDKIIYDDNVSKKYENYKNFDAIEQIAYYLFDKTEIDGQDDFYLLNSLPDYYIKSLIKSTSSLFQHSVIRCAYKENISSIIPDWKNISEKNPFKVYKELMKELNKLEKQKIEVIYFSIEIKDIEYKIDAIKEQAIYFLKKAADLHKKDLNSNDDAKCKIELAAQYIKGYLLPCNITKAQDILKSISNANRQKQPLINQMKEKIQLKIKSINNTIVNMPEDQKKIIQKAEKGDILSMLYAGFAFYTGFNGFPVIHSLSIQYYRTASKNSPDAMAFLGFLYWNGIFFPQNFKRSANCFKRAADKGLMKAKIIDGFLRKHKWRNYLSQFGINSFFVNYLQSFSSMIPNDSLVLPKVNYFLEKNIYKDELFLINMKDDKDFLDSNNSFNHSIFLNLVKSKQWNKQVKQSYSEKILLCSEKLENTKDVNQQLFIANSYFNGDNGFPVNYTKAAEFFKLAADNGNSEAQWRFAMLCYNSIGIEYNIETVNHYFQESIKQNNVKGKLYYAIYLKKKRENPDLVEKLIKENCDSGDIESIYYYGMLLEGNITKQEQSIEYYKKAADKGHFDSLIRLVNILKNEKQNENQHQNPEEQEEQQLEIEQSRSFNEYSLLSIGILNYSSLINLIEYYDDNKDYEQSNILIEVGLKINCFSFGFYYIDHLLYGKGMESNIELSKKIAIFLFKEGSPYEINYMLLILQSLVMNNEHQKALGFLFKYRNELDKENRKGFQLFYERFDKKLARHYFIPACFYYKTFVNCHDVLMSLYMKRINLYIFFNKLTSLAKDSNNSFALAIIGRIYKQGRYFTRNLKTAIKYFVCSAKNKCPLGYYYIGKEFFYGRFLNQDFDRAKKYLSLSIQNNDVPKAGYYIFKISTILFNETLDDIEMLKIGVKFGHKRALYKYGHRLYTGKDKLIPQNKIDGIEYIKEAAYLKYKKAKKFCMLHGISYSKQKKAFDFKNDSSDLDDEIEDTSFFSADLNEDEKSSDLIPNKNEKQNCDLFSLSNDEYNSNDDSISLNENKKSSNKAKSDQISPYADELDKNEKSFSSTKSRGSKQTKQDDDKLTNLNQTEIDDSVSSDEDLKSILDEDESFSDLFNFWC